MRVPLKYICSVGKWCILITLPDLIYVKLPSERLCGGKVVLHKSHNVRMLKCICNQLYIATFLSVYSLKMFMMITFGGKLLQIFHIKSIVELLNFLGKD